jgi:hypothetical protein
MNGVSANPTLAANAELHYYSSYTINTFGSYVSGIDEMTAVDSVAAKFIETKHIVGDDATSHEIDTESIVNWTAESGLSVIEAANDRVLCDSYSIKGTVDDKNNVVFEYDGGLDWSTGDIKEFNISINCDHSTTLTGIYARYSDTQYWEYGDTLVMTTGQWNNVTLETADFDPVGRMSHDLTVNEFAFHFTTGANAKHIWLDCAHLIGKQAGDVKRRLSAEIQFDNLPHKDNYQATIVGRYNRTSDYEDAFFTEDHNDWDGSAGITFSRDTTDVQEGTYRMVCAWDAVQNSTFWYDNATTKNMQVDWCHYQRIHQYVWGNTSFIIDYGRFYTDASNYYHADVGVAYGTTPTFVGVPRGVFQSVGSPSWSNISWIEWKINNIDNPDPVEIYFDYLRLTDADGISVYSDVAGNGAEEIVHLENAWQTKTIDLDASSIQLTGSAIITLNDTLRIKDGFNTTLEIDALYITSWNDDTSGGDYVPPTPTTPTTTIPTTTIPERKVIVRPFPVALVIVGGIVIILAMVYEERKKK